MTKYISVGEPLVQQVHELPDCENSQPVFTTPQQPESSRTYGNLYMYTVCPIRL